MSHAADITFPIERAGRVNASRCEPGTESLLATGLAGTLSGYFVLRAGSLYWLVRGAGALTALVLPRSLVERAPMAWLAGSSLLAAASTQTIPGFLPDYTNPSEIGFEVLAWLAFGLLARVYFIATSYPDTFAELRASIEARPIERFFARHLHQPIDAVFTRVWLGNSLAVLPLTVLLVLPSTINYLVIVGYTVVLLMTQLPQEIADHTNIHTRILQPRIGASPRIKRLLGLLQSWFEWGLTLLVARVPGYYRVEHVHIHHAEDNGPADSQTTLPYDRTSFLDFSRHALRQGIDLVSGLYVIRYLHAKGKPRLVREVVRGLLVWYAILAVLALVNPIAALIVFSSRFLGGNVLSLIAFYWHGVVDPEHEHDARGHSIDLVGSGHGNLGDDFHAVHHDHPGRHRSHYYEALEKRTATGRAGMLVQREAFGPLRLVSALWRRDFACIARHAELGEMSDVELARIIEERTRRVDGTARDGALATLDRHLGWIMAAALPRNFGA